MTQRARSPEPTKPVAVRLTAKEREELLKHGQTPSEAVRALIRRSARENPATPPAAPMNTRQQGRAAFTVRRSDGTVLRTSSRRSAELTAAMHGTTIEEA